jgi:riboflavin synthase
MFTGIITGIGTIVQADRSAGADTVFGIETSDDAASIALGASIAHSGICLTVVEREEIGPGKVTWLVQASAETCDLTTAANWVVGTQVNLERSLKVGDELGGHIVSGHVDGQARLVSLEQEKESWRLVFEAPADLSRFIARKGSVALDGVSLTVNSVDGRQFGVNIIPHTWTATTLGQLQVGSKVNLEIDTLARYMARYLDTAGAPATENPH